MEVGEERAHFAEVLRLEGWIQGLLGEPQQAETALRRSLDVTRGQQAKSWELRSAMTLARLWAAQGRKTEALSLLEPVYGWFAEGHDTKDLMMAAQLVEELSRSGRAVRAKRSSLA